jgi:hypothetical protein
MPRALLLWFAVAVAACILLPALDGGWCIAVGSLAGGLYLERIKEAREEKGPRLAKHVAVTDATCATLTVFHNRSSAGSVSMRREGVTP